MKLPVSVLRVEPIEPFTIAGHPVSIGPPCGVCFPIAESGERCFAGQCRGSFRYFRVLHSRRTDFARCIPVGFTALIDRTRRVSRSGRAEVRADLCNPICRYAVDEPMNSGTSIAARCSLRALLRRILSLGDTPHAVALGTTIGVFLACTPTFGIRVLLVLLIALATRRWFYFNRPAALMATCLSNPVTTVPLYYFNYRLGTLFIEGQATRGDFARVLEYQGFHEWWNAAAWLFVDVGTPLLLGSLMIATIAAALTYPTVRWLLGEGLRDEG